MKKQITNSSIYCIVTHHESPDEVANAWISEGVCAVGYCRVNAKNVKSEEDLRKSISKKNLGNNHDINELWKFLQIKKGDIVLAYCGKSKIAAVGKVTGDYYYDKKVENLDYPEATLYPHQRKVRWFRCPRDFDKKELPERISKKLGVRGKTIIPIDYPVNNFLECIKTVPETYKGTFSEELVKAELSKYIKRNLDQLELGLKITKQEASIDKQNRPDFFATDKNGVKVIIECKGYAEDKDIEQIKRYRSSYSKASRYFLIASRVSDECKKEARRNGIEVFEARLNFKKIV